MQNRFTWMAVLTITLGAGLLRAHDYDPNKPVTLSGTVTKVEWHQPYVKIHLDVAGQNGRKQGWEIETVTPQVMQSDGITSAAIKVGDQITVEGIQAKTGSDHALAKSLKLSDGRNVSLASTQESAPMQTSMNVPPAKPAKLPRTASDVPLIGLIGLASLAGWSILAARPRRLS
jgi:hypothetical protein